MIAASFISTSNDNDDQLDFFKHPVFLDSLQRDAATKKEDEIKDYLKHAFIQKHSKLVFCC